MFNNLASYLLGTATTTTGNNDQRHLVATDALQLETNLRLTAAVISGNDDDWVLVDRDSEGNSEHSSEDSDHEHSPTETYDIDEDDIDSDDLTHLLLNRSGVNQLNNTGKTKSKASAHVGNKRRNKKNHGNKSGSTGLCNRSNNNVSIGGASNNMDESWFLTPPPCFTSTGPIQLETSPLENLLIEHPSMSVYQQQSSTGVVVSRRLHVVVDGGYVAPSNPTSSAVLVVEEEGGVEVVLLSDNAGEEDVEGFLQVVHPQQPNTVDAQRQHRNRLLQEEREDVKSKQCQKAQIQRACQSLKRGYLDRNNKTREVNHRNRRQRRGERSQGPTRSHANNNRKC